MKKSIWMPLSLVVLISAVLCVGSPRVVAAGEPTTQLKKTVDAVIDVLRDKELKKPGKEEERRAKLRSIVLAQFGFDEMARRSLGIYWKQRNPEEHKEFVSLFTDLLQNTYIRKIERYKDEHVEYGEEKTDGPYSTVKTDIVSTKDQRIPVEYRLLKTGERWEVYDIIIEGVSLVNNYRGQFAQIIRSSSYEELVKRLRKKTVKEPS